MPKQRWLPLGGQENMEELWDRFPDPSRREVVKQYARLMARAAGLTAAPSPSKEAQHGSVTDATKHQDSP